MTNVNNWPILTRDYINNFPPLTSRYYKIYKWLRLGNMSRTIFGNTHKYFYIFGLNKKFCDGIKQWNQTVNTNTSSKIRDLILQWHGYDCSQDQMQNFSSLFLFTPTLSGKIREWFFIWVIFIRAFNRRQVPKSQQNSYDERLF